MSPLVSPLNAAAGQSASSKLTGYRSDGAVYAGWSRGLPPYTITLKRHSHSAEISLKSHRSGGNFRISEFPGIDLVPNFNNFDFHLIYVISFLAEFPLFRFPAGLLELMLGLISVISIYDGFNFGDFNFRWVFWNLISPGRLFGISISAPDFGHW